MEKVCTIKFIFREVIVQLIYMKIWWGVFEVFFIYSIIRFFTKSLLVLVSFFCYCEKLYFLTMKNFMKIVFFQVWKRKYFAWAKNTIPCAAFFLEIFVSLSVNFIVLDMNPYYTIITFNSFMIFRYTVITYFTWKLCWHILSIIFVIICSKVEEVWNYLAKKSKSFWYGIILLDTWCYYTNSLKNRKEKFITLFITLSASLVSKTCILKPIISLCSLTSY